MVNNMSENFDAERMVADVAALATEMHARDTPPRDGSGLPYIVHPTNVVKMLGNWGFNAGNAPLIVALGWAHDLKEDTSVTDDEIVHAGGPLGRQLLEGVNALTFITYADSHSGKSAMTDSEEAALKAEYIKRVAQGNSEFLVVKMADRICNSIERAEVDPVRALKYLKKGEVLFARIGELVNGDKIKSTLDELYAELH